MRKGRGPSDERAEKEGKKGTEYGKHQNIKKKRGWGVGVGSKNRVRVTWQCRTRGFEP